MAQESMAQDGYMKHRRTFGLALVAVLTSTLLIPLAPADAASSQPRRIVTGWIPYWQTADGTASVEANADLFNEVSPFWHSATGTTSISSQVSPSTRNATVARLKAAGVRVIPSVTDGTSARTMSGILRSNTTRTQHVNALVSLVMSNGYDGIDLDYEKFAFSDGSSTWAQTRPAWVSFVKQLGSALHAKGKLLTVATPEMTADAKGYWVYDWRGIGASIDRLRIMTYDYSVSAAGPIGPLPWVRNTIAYAVAVMPAWKVQVGVAAYGRDWVTSRTGTCPTTADTARITRGTRDMQTFVRDNGIPTTWNSTYGERTFTYSRTFRGTTSTGAAATCTLKRTAWYQDGSSAKVRAALVGQYKLAGISFWALGDEDPASWSALRTYAKTVSPSPTVAWIGAPRYAVAGSTISVSARVWIAGIPTNGVTLSLMQRRPGRTTTWSVVAATSSGADGRAVFAVRPQRNVDYLVRASSGWDHTAGTSAVVRTNVSPAVALDARVIAGRAGSVVTARGSTLPVVRGQVVLREQLRAGRWVVVGSTRSDTAGRFRAPMGVGAGTYRFAVAATSTNLAGFSLRLTVRAT